MTKNHKFSHLTEGLKGYREVGIAFSGGKDSFFLLEMSIEALGKTNVIAFFINGNFTSKLDFKRLDYFRRILDFNLKIIKVDFSSEKKIWSNSRDRCYLCKRFIFKKIKTVAKKVGITRIFDGSTYSDLSRFRPGFKAIRELGIISPLIDYKITSEEIEKYLKSRKLHGFYLTPSSCLATRFPYRHTLTMDDVKIYDEVEFFLNNLEIFPVKIRYIPDGIRIETSLSKFSKIFAQKEEIIAFCESRGLKFIALDLGGIKSGVWD